MSELLLANHNSANVNDLLALADADFAGHRMTEAIDGYRRILSARPRDVHALHRISLAYVHINDFDEAYAHIQLALKAAPKNAELWEHAGLIAAYRREYVCAEAFYRRAIDIARSTATVHRNLADCLQQLGQLTEAKIEYKRAVEIEPKLHHAIRAIARISLELGETNDAADFWERAWAIDSSHPLDGTDMVTALAKANRIARLDEAVAEISARFADNADVLEVLAHVLYKHDRFSAALDVARQGLTIDPTRAPFHHYAALALGTRGKIVESLPYSMEAARLWPDNAVMQYQLAGVQLACGNFKEGWPRHKAFYALPASKASLIIPTNIPEWSGEPVAGCQFLLVGEQGDGDKIQCIRFAEWLHRQGATVDLLVTQPVAQVAATMKCIRTVFSSESPPGPYDYWTHLLKIPEHIGLDMSRLPGVSIPYVFAPPEKLRCWRTRIEAASPANTRARRRRIGIVWAGRPTYVFDRFRSVPLDAFKPLFALPGTTWFSLQKGERERESEALANEFDIHTLGPAIEDFIDTLATLETLDLVITVDTSVAHLAGAAGRPVWVLVPAYVEWRWIIDRTDSPWYPSMRLFRQRELGQWDAVIEEVRSALQVWCTQP